MTVANTTTKLTYDGDNASVTFAIPFNFLSGEASLVTKVYLINELVVDLDTPSGFDETLWTEGTEYTLDPAGPTPANVKTDAGAAPHGAPTNDEKVRVQRDTAQTQSTDLDTAGPNTPYNPTAIENQLDRTIHHVQELDDKIDEVEAAAAVVTMVSGAAIPDWAPATNYLTDQVIVDKDTPSNKIYRALSDHLSQGNFNLDFVGGEWELLPNGADGLDGANGNDGVDSRQFPPCQQILSCVGKIDIYYELAFHIDLSSRRSKEAW